MRLLVPGVAVLVVGCVTSGPKALKPSVEEVMPASPSVVFQAALKAVTDQGLPLREAEATNGVIQTNYVDISSFDRMGASQYPASERLVRFRVLIGTNPNGPGSVIAIFGIYAPFRAGISNSERNERAVPRDHPAMSVVRDMRDAIAESVGM